ncbi:MULTISPECIES: glycogen debranching protein GlgX [Paraburkholderia]|jgi:glycogen operon protein|uniref:Glycogen operon protein n=2 Tax=Paraburkholderia TaxID=1822464 RepID=A0AB73ICX5_9BURK|nr:MULTISPECIES: glycogen debranching protein GlgX [Paraburkholderia]OWJ61504.1 glycogen debranching enzyme [Burkholderia sp. Bk]MDP9647009.1 glycogen operon protein [Paraburkholderia caledonica]MDR6376547.1 glycogen operon protein [Paraburkholderia caledonica]MDR7003304.1 glycogen operon protein [Paraburkholderia strydomiana]TCG02559.1 glycogen debranching enzyme [Paraburkholderia strydomiana]
MSSPANYSTRIAEGTPFPLGATWNGNGVNFALFSAHATKVELCLFDETGQHEIERIELPEYTDEVWHVFVPNLKPGAVYGYRVHGPYEPEKGHRFNPNKLLLDPYAKAHIGELKWAPEIFGYTLGSEEGDLSFDERDSAPFVPKCKVVDATFSWSHPERNPLPWDRVIFYETHVRGFTKRHPEVPEELRGTFAGLGQKPVIDYIKSLGVTSVELMPVQTFVNDSYLLEKGLTNYWGYNTIGFFAADPRFFASSTDSVSEFKGMVDSFHNANLEVILDVVYNHTAEGNERGPTLSFKGIDNASYYRLMPDEPRYYINDTGTGNTLNLSHPRVLQMVTDSLRYWVTEMKVDGFRFDLATILGREPHGFDEGGGFLDSCRQDPVLSSVRLVAEPWDCGPGGYQVGGFPPGWAEWNDRFRDTVRAYWKGDEGMVADLAARLTGSGDKFNHRGRRPWASVNFIAAHDGFTLNDLVSYNDKHNEANGEDNKDGHSDNKSWNMGVEGPTDDIDIRQQRERQKRNLLSTLLLSQGTPMILAGDEFGRTQKGNNNAYCQDNEISWVDWEGIDEDGRALTEFVRNLTTLRHRLPVLRRSRFLTGEYNEALDVTDARWLSPDGTDLTPEQWADPLMRCFGLVIDGRAQASGIRRPASDATLLLVLNAHHDVVNFTLPEVPEGERWTCLLDTNMPVRAELPQFSAGDDYQVTARSLLLFALEAPSRATQRVFDRLEEQLTSDESEVPPAP